MPTSLDYLRDDIQIKHNQKRVDDGRMMNIQKMLSNSKKRAQTSIGAQI